MPPPSRQPFAAAAVAAAEDPSLFDVVLEVWNSGRRLGKLPPADYEEPEPEKPPNYDTDPKARIVYLTRQKQYLHAKANNHSDRCNVNYKIEIARTVCIRSGTRVPSF